VDGVAIGAELSLQIQYLCLLRVLHKGAMCLMPGFCASLRIFRTLEYLQDILKASERVAAYAV
jgi:hypothetical protein